MGGSLTLQSVYDNDPDGSDATITTNATDGAVVIAGDQELRVSATNGLNVDTRFDFDGTFFDVLMTAGGFSIDGVAASNLSVTSGNLTLSTLTSGTLFLTSAGLLDVDAAASIDIDVTGTFDVLATGAFSLDGTGASNVTATAGNLTLSTLTSGNVIINSVAVVDIDGASATLDTTGSFSLDGAAASNVSVTGADLTLSTITSGVLVATSAGLWDLNAGANLDIDVTGTFDMLSTGVFSIDGTGASNVSATSGNLTLSTITTGTLFLTSAGLLDVDAAASIDIDTTGSFDVLATGVFSIDGTGASNITATSGNLTLSTTTSGSLLLTSAGDSTYTVPNASATAFALTDGTATYLRIDSVSDAVDLPKFVNITGEGIGVEIVTDSALVLGSLVRVAATTGNVGLADADTGSLRDGWASGVSTGTFSATDTAEIVTGHGSLVSVLFAAAPAAASNGLPVYVSTTAGQGTLTAPSGGSDKVTFIVGILQGADGATTTPKVIWMPQFISKGAGVT
jgi:hypothetical protein